jgi:short-subunit dehydrogenase
MTEFKDNYGPWAVVAGASEGLGEAFARACASRGVNVILVARREHVLRALADDIAHSCNVSTKVIVADLGTSDGLNRVLDETRDLDVGLIIYNAIYPLIGPFWSVGVEEHRKEIDVNIRGPLVLAHAFGERMRARGRGGIVLLSSMAGFQGAARIVNYAATKAYNLVLGEGLWEELRGSGVDALVCAPGATRTPNYERSDPSEDGSWMVYVQEARDVANETLEYLGRGPLLIPGRMNRLQGIFMRRILPRRAAVRILGWSMRKQYDK